MKARSVGTFVQIGGMIINMARVVEGYIGDCEVTLYYLPRISAPTDDLEERHPVILKGERREAFLEWWECQAALSACEPFRL